jgi:signal transduction histidine kinase
VVGPEGFEPPVPLIKCCEAYRNLGQFDKANAEFLTQSDISETERAEFYQEIRCSIERMNELVSSLSECSKGRDTLRPSVRNIVDTVARAIRMTSVRREFRRITIEHRHKGLAVGWYDPHRLERLVGNLVLNACESVSPDTGQIVITTTGNRASLRIDVWDNGPGIPPNDSGLGFSTLRELRKGRRQRSRPRDSEEDHRGSWRGDLHRWEL